ncbi:MAG: LacI family DNA-binding transcriptional regulator [Acidobacteriaceae bacterium]
MKRSRKPADKSTPPKIDIRGVASRARVSIATVSRTINHVPTVDPILAARVWKAVTELNYFPNTQARALVSGKSRLIGLIVSEITNPFFPELIQEFEQTAVSRGYEILIGSTNYETKTMEMCARRMLERKVDGVAILTFGIEDFLLDRFASENIPYVFIDPAPSRPLNSVIAVDYRAGIYEGVQHLAVLGHRNIGFISGPLTRRSAQSRKAAFLNCLQSAGLKPNPDWLIEGNHALDGGHDAMQKILAMPNWPTAIMCSNDMTAIGVQHALFEANLRVPDDFSLIGFDDIHLAEYTIPPLTSIRMSCRDLAKAAIDNLLSRLKTTEALKETPTKISTRLIVRQTTGLPRNSLQDLRESTRRRSRKRESV